MISNRNKTLLKLINFKFNKRLSHDVAPAPKSIEFMPRPKSLPIVGTKLDFIAAGGGSK